MFDGTYFDGTYFEVADSLVAVVGRASRRAAAISAQPSQTPTDDVFVLWFT